MNTQCEATKGGFRSSYRFLADEFESKKVIDLARMELPVAIEALNRANLEAQKVKPDMEKLSEALGDVTDPYCDVSDAVRGFLNVLRLTHKEQP